MATCFVLKLEPDEFTVSHADKNIQCTIVHNADKHTQCSLVLCAKMQAEKERKAAQRVKGTQTLKDTTTKSVQTLAAGKHNLVCEDLSRGKCQLSKPSFSDWKRARPSTENGCLDVPTLKASCATQTDDVEVVGTAVEKAMYALKSVEDLGNLSYKLFNDRFLKKNKLLITDSSLMGAAGYNGDPVSLCLDEDGILSEQVLLCPPKETDLTEYGTLDIGVFIDYTKEFFSKQKVICEGIPILDPSDVTCLPSTVSVHLAPRRHLRSKKCPVWYQSSGGKHMCLHCRQGEASLKAKKKGLGQATPAKKRLRQYASNKSRLCTLTSSTKKKRLQAKRTVRLRLQKKVDNMMDKIELSSEQSSSLSSVVQTINLKFRETLDEVISEADENVQATLRQVWEKDSQERDAKNTSDFFSNQEKNRPGKESNTWSTITYRIALAVYCRSPAAYCALQSFGVLQLPSLRSLQLKSANDNNKAGLNHEYLQEQKEKYLLHEEFVRKGKPAPKHDGVLICDEVKIINKLAWNSKSMEFVGVVMTEEEAPHLYDIFRNWSANSNQLYISKSESEIKCPCTRCGCPLQWMCLSCLTQQQQENTHKQQEKHGEIPSTDQHFGEFGKDYVKSMTKSKPRRIKHSQKQKRTQKQWQPHSQQKQNQKRNQCLTLKQQLQVGISKNVTEETTVTEAKDLFSSKLKTSSSQSAESNDLSNSSGSNSSGKVFESSHAMKFKCDVCDKEFRTVTYLKRHKLVHTGLRPFMCHICGQDFIFNRNLKNHMLSHTGVRAFVCDICHKAFAQASVLNRHKLTHIGHRPYVCGICKYAFTQAGNLKMHMVTHTGEKPYVCDVCSSSFTQSITLKLHKMKHTSQKSHICDICSKAFYTIGQLNRHKHDKHSVDGSGPKSGKKLACDICNKTFNFACNLKRHKLVHTGEKTVICEICSKAFYTAHELKSHMFVHTGQKNYSCDVCYKAFSHARYLKQHRVKVHKFDLRTNGRN